MAQLSERDLALLSSLMYCDEVVKSDYNNKTLSKLVSHLLEKDDAELWETKLTGDFDALGMEEGGKAFREVLKALSGSDALMSLTYFYI